MNEQTFIAILTFLGAVLAAVLFVMDRSNRRVADSLPPDTLNLMYGLLALAEALAKVTPTTADDELVADLRKAFGKDEAPAQPTVTELVEGAEG